MDVPTCGTNPLAMVMNVSDVRKLNSLCQQTWNPANEMQIDAHKGLCYCTEL